MVRQESRCCALQCFQILFADTAWTKTVTDGDDNEVEKQRIITMVPSTAVDDDGATNKFAGPWPNGV